MPIKKLQAHIFICTNERAADHPRGCCKGKGSEALVGLFKDELKKQGITDVRAQKAGCLDACEQGPSIVIYPDNIWYGAVCPEDVPEIIRSHWVEGRPLERLKMPGK